MGADSKIEWCHHTFNPWWGCQRVSPGCKHCYAETLAKRYGHKVWGGRRTPRRFFGDKHWNEPVKWNARCEKEGIRERVFCASQADVFEDRRDLDAPRSRLFALMIATPNLDWLLLTKRPQNVERLALKAHREMWKALPDERYGAPIHLLPQNAWLGVTAEDQKHAAIRIPIALSIPATKHFVSYEPAIGPVDFEALDAEAAGHPTMYFVDALRGRQTDMGRPCPDAPSKLDWIIVGGESGGGARPFEVGWARRTVRACKAAGVAVFVKQFGAKPITRESSAPFDVNVLRLLNRKGNTMTEWPEDLRVREFPR